MNTRNMTTAGLVALALATLPSLSGCNDHGTDFKGETNASGKSPSDLATTKQARLEAIVHRGNGVYVFPKSDFAQTLADFKGANPNLRVISHSVGDDNRHGAENFVVNTEPR